MATRIPVSPTQAEFDALSPEDKSRFAYLANEQPGTYRKVQDPLPEPITENAPVRNAAASVLPTPTPAPAAPVTPAFVPPVLAPAFEAPPPMVVNHPQQNYSHQVGAPCAYGLCGKTDAVSAGGANIGYIAPNKTVNGMPSADEFSNMSVDAARRMRAIGDQLLFGYKFAGPAEMNRAYDTNAIMTNRYTPEWQAEHAAKSALYGDVGAAALADRRMAEAQGQFGALGNSGVLATNQTQLNEIQNNLVALAGLNGSDGKKLTQQLPVIGGLAPRGNVRLDTSGRVVAYGSSVDPTSYVLPSADPLARQAQMASYLNPSPYAGWTQQLSTRAARQKAAELAVDKAKIAVVAPTIRANAGIAITAQKGVTQIGVEKLKQLGKKDTTTQTNQTKKDISAAEIASKEKIADKKPKSGLANKPANNSATSLVVPR